MSGEPLVSEQSLGLNMAEFEDLAVFLMVMFHDDVKLQEDNNPKLLDMG